MSDKEKEIELKICINKIGVERVFKIFSKKAIDGKIKKKHRPRRYFDTKNRDIEKCKMALRVQYKEKLGYEQTLKYTVSDQCGDSSVMTRMEIKNLLPKKQKKPDISLIDLSIVKDKNIVQALKDISTKKLQHVFTSSVKRRYFCISVLKKNKKIGIVELAFDMGLITHAKEKDLSYNISEIEIELKSGSIEAIQIAKEEILEIINNDGQISNISKAEQGYILDKMAIKRQKRGS